MKTNMLILTVALLLLGGGFVACNDSEQAKAIGIPPVSTSGDVYVTLKNK